MTTDFTYGNKTITTSGPTKPATKNSPGDVRTRVQTYADISTIPMPYIGMPIVVLTDETNGNKMTEYRVKSLKANTLGVQDTVVNEVVRLKDFLEISNSGNVSQEDIKAAVNDYLEENPVQSGATAEQVAQRESNKTAIQTLETLVGVDETVGDKTGLPSGDANIIASINRIDSKPGGTVTDEQIGTAVNNYLTEHPVTALTTTDKTVVGAINELKNGINNIYVPNKVSELTNDSMYVTNSQLNELLNGSGITPPEIDSTLRWIVAPETLELTPGISKEITVTINDTATRCNFRFGSNANILTFSGTDLFRGENTLVFNNGETSKNITITAKATDRKLVDYLYFGDYGNNNGYNVIQTKTKIIVNPSSETIGVESISLSQNSLSINKGETATLNANISPAGATNKNVTWSANNSNVSLTPNALSCEILGNTAGSSVVTVTTEDGNKTASCNITINETQSTETYGNIVLSKTSETISENSTTTFTVKLDAPPTNNQTVSLSSNNSDVTLDKNSLIFTSSNYNEEQTVTITIAKDSDYNDDTCKITATSSNVANVYLELTITDVDTPSVPTGNIITDGLQVYIDGRDVEKGSTQAYWSNKVEGSSLEQIPIVGQFGTPYASWNDTTKTYGWLGDSFRYYLENKIQPTNAIPNFDENTKEFTIEIGFLKEAQTIYNSINTAFTIFNAGNVRVSNITLQPKADGTVRTYCSVNGVSTYTDTSTDTAVKHYAITSNGDDTVSVYDNSELLATLSAKSEYPFVYPFDSFTIAQGSFTQNVRIYYLRIYNRKLTTEEMRNNYQYESSIERSTN